MPNRLAVVIPAYRPSEGLINLVRNLTEGRIGEVVVVDDGSGPDYRDIFAQLSALPKVHLLRHGAHLGRGAALKTAFNHVLCTIPDLAGVVTVDTEGNNDPDHIERVAAKLMEQPDALVLGARAAETGMPLRRRFGNFVSRGLLRGLLGRRFADTQTELRGIPARLLPRLLRIEANGREFEYAMLIATHQLAMPVIEERIESAYRRDDARSRR